MDSMLLNAILLDSILNPIGSIVLKDCEIRNLMANLIGSLQTVDLQMASVRC